MKKWVRDVLDGKRPLVVNRKIVAGVHPVITHFPKGVNAVAVRLGNSDGSFLVSPSDYASVRLHRWVRKHRGDGRWYVYASMQGKQVSLHRWLLSPSAGEYVDHINGDGLDNRRENLRSCTNRQNTQNHRKYGELTNRKTSSRFIGVHRPSRTNAYRASIQVNGKKIQLGIFISEEDAAKKYDAAAIEHFGEFARLNFPAAVSA